MWPKEASREKRTTESRPGAAANAFAFSARGDQPARARAASSRESVFPPCADARGSAPPPPCCCRVRPFCEGRVVFPPLHVRLSRPALLFAVATRRRSQPRPPVLCRVARKDRVEGKGRGATPFTPGAAVDAGSWGESGGGGKGGTSEARSSNDLRSPLTFLLVCSLRGRIRPMPRLIVNADDLGYSAERDEGIVSARGKNARTQVRRDSLHSLFTCPRDFFSRSLVLPSPRSSAASARDLSRAPR
jgi:hypothetical protein